MMPDDLREKIKERVKDKLPTPPAATSALNGKPKHNAPVAHYDSGRKTYWLQNSRGEWMEVQGGALKLYLRSIGLKDTFQKGQENPLTELEQELLRIQHSLDVHYSGALAGYPVGHYDVCGNRVLVTRGPATIEENRGEWETIRRLVVQLLPEQFLYFYGWIKAAREANAAGPPFRPGQMLAIAGPPGCGKSLIQGLITEILGGRCAKPYRYLTAHTDFNSELFAAEHLAIEDEASTTDLRTRKQFGAQLKNLVANEVQSFHAKGRQALSLTPFWRVSITLNDEPESLLVLPPIDTDLKDKIIFLKAAAASFPFDEDDLAGRKRYRETLSAELPAFLFFLRRWKIPQDLTHQRYGVAAWQNLELTAAIDDLAPEMRLLSLIEMAIFDDFHDEWVGSAAELERALREKKAIEQEVSRLLTFNTACGVYLSRLSKKQPEKVASFRGENNRAKWKIRKS
jgi:hypothetical protein